MPLDLNIFDLRNNLGLLENLVNKDVLKKCISNYPDIQM